MKAILVMMVLLAGFTVTVICMPTIASEVATIGGTVTVYDLTSTTTKGCAPGSQDYIERQIQVSIAQ